MIRLRLPRRRRWCEIRFRWKHGWWCPHYVMTPWEQFDDEGFVSARQCMACGVVELR